MREGHEQAGRGGRTTSGVPAAATELAEALGAPVQDQCKDDNQLHGDEIPLGRQMTQGPWIWGGNGGRGMQGQEEGHSV